MTDDIVDSAGLRAAFHISEPTVYRWVANGCPHMRRPHGKRTHLYFRLSDVEAWLRPPAQEEEAA